MPVGEAVNLSVCLLTISCESSSHYAIFCLWMELYAVSAKPGKRRAFRWDKKFTQRERRAYPAKDRKLTPEANQTIVDAFFRELTSRLDPP